MQRDEILTRLKEEFDYYEVEIRMGRVWTPTRLERILDIFDLVELWKYKRFLDAGSGKDARVVVVASVLHGLESDGIEIDEKLVQKSQEKIKRLSDLPNIEKVRIIHGNYFEHDLSQYDVIYHYPDGPPIEFAQKCAREMKNGIVLFYAFNPHLPDAELYRKLELWVYRK